MIKSVKKLRQGSAIRDNDLLCVAKEKENLKKSLLEVQPKFKSPKIR